MDYEMQRLHPDMMARYEIDDRRPERVNAVQFGMSDILLGAVDRLIDDARLGVGIACVDAGGAGYAEKLNRQEGLYTVVVRGDVNEEPLRREQVVQCLKRACGPENVEALAENPEIAFGIVDDDEAARALAERFNARRQAAKLAPVFMLRLGENALIDSLAFRSEPDEAARQCAEMNYLDDMLYLAEPYARLTVCAPADFREGFPLDRAGGVSFADEAGLQLAQRLKSQVFDAGLFLMAAAGWLNGCDTLFDCMKHQRLRRFVGEGFTKEIMPALADVDRAQVAQAVIDSFGRYENPLTRNRILRAADHLIRRFTRGALPAMRRLSEENFEPPRRLSFALAATIMLYAGARRGQSGYEVARGRQIETLHDDEAVLQGFSTLAHDMPPESLAYAALADRELWGADLRAIDGLEERVALDIANMQRQPGYLPEA